MKRYLIILLSLLLPVTVGAQELKVLEIKTLEHSLKARTAQVRDNNGALCALVEVAAPKLEGLAFDENRHIGPVEYADGVYSLFVPAETKTIGFKHRDYMPGSINFEANGIRVESGMVYSVGLQRMDVAAEYQYLVINVSPNDALVELDGRVQQVSEGTVSSFVQVGTTHHYKVSAAGKLSEEGDVTVKSAEQKTEINVALRDNSSKVRIVAVRGAQIYVNDRLVGKDIWEGSLAPGIFKIEARIGGQTVSSEACTVRENVVDVQEYVLEVFYGSVNVTSVQPKVSVTLDGEEIGTTPLLKSRILPGRHNLIAHKQGFNVETKNVLIERNKTTEVSFDLKEETMVVIEKKDADKQIKEKSAAKTQSSASVNVAKRAKTNKDFGSTGAPGIIVPDSGELPYGGLTGYINKVGDNVKSSSNFDFTKPVISAKDAKPAKTNKGFGFVGASGGFAPGSGELSFGGMVGYVKKIGVYAKFRSNFDFTKPGGHANSSDPIWKDDTYSAKRLHATAGVLIHAFGPVYPYAGAGYGFREVYAEDIYRDQSRVDDYSHFGTAIDAGVLLHFGHLVLNLGVSTATFKYADIDFGIGFSF